MIRTKRKLAELEARIEALEEQVACIERNRWTDMKMICRISGEVGKIYGFLSKATRGMSDALEMAIEEVENERK